MRREKQIKILLTGASSQLGKEVLRALLLENQYDITVFDSKTPASASFLTPLENRFELVYGDITRKSDIRKAACGIDVVLHLSNVNSATADKNPELAYNINVNGTNNLLSSLQENSSNSFILYASSASLYGNRWSSPLITVNDTIHADSKYEESIYLTENLIKNSGFQWSIFRMAPVLGYGSKIFSKEIFESSLQNTFEFISLADAVRAFLCGIQKTDELKNTVFNVSGGDKCRVSYGDYLQIIFTAYGLGKVDFPKEVFSDDNYKNGYYMDGDILNNILSFRKDTLYSYYTKLKENVSPATYSFNFLFNNLIKKYLLKQSIYYKNHKEELLTPYSTVYA